MDSVATQITSWCAGAAHAPDGAASVTEINTAEKRLKAATDDIRNDRLAPLAS